MIRRVCLCVVGAVVYVVAMVVVAILNEAWGE